MHVILAILAMDLTAQICTIDSSFYPGIRYSTFTFNERRKRQPPADISSIFVQEIKYNMYFSGYILDVDECSNNTYHGNATSNNTIGSCMCACYPGYSGDRFECTGVHLTSYPANIDNTENLHSR